MRVWACVLSLFTCGMASYLLWHFSRIWTMGEFHISRQHPALLLAEIIIVLVILMFSFIFMIKQLDRIGSRRK